MVDTADTGSIFQLYTARCYNTMLLPQQFAAPNSHHAETGPFTFQRFETLLSTKDNMHGFALIMRHVPLVNYTPVVMGLSVALHSGDVMTGYMLAKAKITPRMLAAFAANRVAELGELASDAKKVLNEIGVDRAQHLLRGLLRTEEGAAVERGDAVAFERFVANGFALPNGPAAGDADADAGVAANYAFLREQVPVVKRSKKVGSRADKAAATAASVASADKKVAPPAAAAAGGLLNDDEEAEHCEQPAATAKKPSKKKSAEAAAAAAAAVDVAAATPTKKRARDTEGGKASEVPLPTSQVIGHLAPYDESGVRRCAVYGCDKTQDKKAAQDDKSSSSDDPKKKKKKTKGILAMDHRLWENYAMVAMCCKQHCKADLPEHGTACILCRRSGGDGKVQLITDATNQKYFYHDVSCKADAASSKTLEKRAPKPVVICLGCASKTTMRPIFEANHYYLHVEMNDEQLVVSLERRPTDKPVPTPTPEAWGELQSYLATMNETDDLKPMVNTTKSGGGSSNRAAAGTPASSSSRADRVVVVGQHTESELELLDLEPEAMPMDEDKSPAPKAAAKPSKAVAHATPSKPSKSASAKSSVPKAVQDVLDAEMASLPSPNKKRGTLSAPAAAAAPLTLAADEMSKILNGEAAPKGTGAEESDAGDGIDLLGFAGF